jgi:hypothetical protein
MNSLERIDAAMKCAQPTKYLFPRVLVYCHRLILNWYNHSGDIDPKGLGDLWV